MNTEAQEARLRLAVARWVLIAPDKGATYGDLVDAQREYRAAKAAISGYEDGWQPNYERLMRRLWKAPAREESVADHLAANAKDRLRTARTKASQKGGFNKAGTAKGLSGVRA